ncbi:MAG: UPF0175 family protein [Candidatus Diapherotrites archaeon]|nr:UPF0175 family protein [Candidatus Diapherotrites archaeon]
MSRSKCSLKKSLKLGRVADSYKKGKASIDKAAKVAGLTVSEMMETVAARGMKSDETVEDYRQGVRALLKKSTPSAFSRRSCSFRQNRFKQVDG